MTGPTFDEASLRSLVRQEEGQYFDRKSLFEGPPDRKRPRDRRQVRDEIALHVAAFANADGGTLVCGVEDDGAVTGHAFPDDAVEDMLRVPERRLRPPLGPGVTATIDGRAVLVFEIAPAPRAVQVVGDGFPRREGDQVVQSSEELINRLKDAGFIASPEAQAATRGSVADLDPSLLSRAMAAEGLSDDVESYLVRRRLADRRGDELVLRNAGIWLFARDPALIDHPNLGVRVWRVHGVEQRVGAGRNVQDYPRIEGNLVSVLERTYDLLTSLIRTSAKLYDLFFRETPEYPTFAWQEALVNALAHRDYGIQGRCVEVWLYEDRMEIASPGGLPPDVSVDDLSARKRVHVSRNPRLARVLTELGIMREQGEGIPRMIEEMEHSWLPPPEFESSREFRVVLRNSPVFEGRDPKWTEFIRGLPLDVRQKRALVAFSDRQSFQSADYQQLNRVDRDLAYRELSDLVERDLLEVEGVRRGATYRVRTAALSTAAQPASGRELLIRRMQEAGQITNADYREAFGVGRDEAKQALNAFVEAGVLERRGERRGAHYVPGAQWPPALDSE